METHACPACGKLFLPRPQNPSQAYCSSKGCQQERRRRWQQAKRENDEDYRDNQKRAQQAWKTQNPSYWRDYRRLHPQYAEANRAQQLVRNYKNCSILIAKMDASTQHNSMHAGLYKMVILPGPLIAKKNAWMVFLSPCSRSNLMYVP
ncbi:hypothetical protein [Undibacterium terreum]|uniref:Uncharacterized protein n=1 Tax=Undibacterium terreum TaxID=1224302 RepID=A0A916XL79_9BURK|nr:hypothetical protein [Undibacterium terreum]GGC83475.1 hypothetical protein GCM10011396_33610 [Undibacterium terreum]